MYDPDQLKAALLDGSVKPMILDTDTYNEVDDQFALAYALLRSDKVRLLSVNAAPFFNSRSLSPEDGMEKSYQEILNILRLAAPDRSVPAYRGSRAYLPDRKTPVQSPAAQNIVDTVNQSSEPVFVVAIGAITNVASALLLDPSIAQNMAVIWLGGHAHFWPDTREFNLVQDIPAAQVVFDSAVPFLQLPCNGVVTMLGTTVVELKHYLGGKNPLCDYLVNIVAEYMRVDDPEDTTAWSKVIWDVSAVAALCCPEALQIVRVPAPLVTDDGHYAFDQARRHMLYTRWLDRDRIFGDLFHTLARA